MSIILSHQAVSSSGASPISLSSLIQVTNDGNNPSILFINASDFADYPATASGASGQFVGQNGASLGLVADNPALPDLREAQLAFSYDAASGRYYSAVYGYLDQLSFRPPAGTTDFVRLAVWGGSQTTGKFTVTALGAIGIATQLKAAPAASRATANGLAATAMTFVGRNWSNQGDWTLMQIIAAESGTTLPLPSPHLLSGPAGQSLGDWTVAYDGAAGGSWQTQLRKGDLLVFGQTPQGSDQMAICVSGSGGSAKLLDAAAVYDAKGHLLNPATDGSSHDVTIAAPHAASQELSGINPSQVMIYRLTAAATAGSAMPAMDRQYDLLVQGMAGLPAAAGQGQPSGFEIPPVDPPRLAVHP